MNDMNYEDNKVGNKLDYEGLCIFVPKSVKTKLQLYCKRNGVSLNKLFNDFVGNLDLDM